MASRHYGRVEFYMDHEMWERLKHQGEESPSHWGNLIIARVLDLLGDNWATGVPDANYDGPDKAITEVFKRRVKVQRGT